MKIIIQTVPYSEMRYKTAGDWFYHGGDLQVVSADLGDEKMEVCLAVHELIEALLCRFAGVTVEQVYEFDIKFTGEGEPGHDPKSPYHSQHLAAESIEKYVADILKVNWEEYDKKVNSL